MTAPPRRAFGVVPASAERLLPVELRAGFRARFGLQRAGDLGFVPEPPVPAAGERTGPPDFVVLGESGAGAEWWMACIADHPAVAPHRTVVEASDFFAPFGTARFGPGDVARFHALFPRRPGRVIGHWSPDGLVHPWVPPLLAEAAPRAHLLVLVRDPVERLRARLDATADIRAPHPGSYVADAVDRGFVAGQLGQLLRWFPKAQVRVVQYEQCRADPTRSLAGTYAFLGIDPDYRPRTVDPPPETVRDPLAPATRQRLHDLYAADVAALAGLVADLDLELWPNFGARTMRVDPAGSRTGTTRNVLLEDTSGATRVSP